MTIKLNQFFHSFRFSLTMLFVGILAIILTIFSVFLYNRQQQVLQAEAVTRLSNRSAQLAAYFSSLLRTEYEEPEERQPRSIPPQDLPLFEKGDLLAVIGLDGALIQEQGGIQKPELRTLIDRWNNNPAQAEPMLFHRTSSDDRESQIRTAYLYQVTPIGFEEKWQGALFLGTPLDPGEQLQRFAVTLLLTDFILLLTATVGGYWLADRAMRPVQTMTRTVRQIGESDLSKRLDLKRQDEIGELADTFDRMLGRLQAAFDRQRQFTADASHELRTPLAIIELELNRALEKRRTIEEYEQALNLIQSENERMSQLVQELLLLARMDSGQNLLHNEMVDLSELTVGVLERLSDIAAARKVRLSTGMLAEAVIFADRGYLTQLATNLVENAIKYSQGDQAQVLVETGQAKRDGSLWTWISVSDNGPGIAAEHIPHLFDRFYRIDSSRKQDEGDAASGISGSGLGLAIADSIVKAYGGRIEVKSEIGIGTEFTAWLMNGG